MGKRRHFLRVMSHKGARRLMSMALAAALVLSSVPTAALAEVMDATVPQEQVVPIEKSAPAEDDGTTAAEASAASEEEPPNAAPTEVASPQDGSQQATPEERGAWDRTLATTITNADGTNSDEGAQVRIGTANEALGNALGTAQLKARRLAGADLSSVADALGRDAEGMQVDAYDVQLLSGGQRLELQKTDEATAWLPKRDGATMYHVKDGVATKLDASVDGGNDLLRADVDDLGTLAVAYPSDKEAAPAAPAASEGQAASESAPSAGPAQSGPAGEMALTGVDRAPAASLAGGPSVLDGLPASSAELAPGKYIVSANVSMLTPLGFPGYTTNPYNPERIGGMAGIPMTPATDNATLVVGKDGTRTLTVNLVNPVFTVQNAEDGEGVTVLSAVRKDIEKKTAEEGSDYEEYNKTVADAGVTSRICQLTVNLKSWSGSYRFGNWKTYATTLNAFFPNSDPKFSDIKSLDLSVDLAHATKVVEGDFSRTLKDEKTGVEVEVYADEGSSVIPKLQDAELRVDTVESGSAHEAASSMLAQLYSDSTTFNMYDVQLISGGKPIDLDSKVRFKASMPVGSDDVSVYAFAAGRLMDTSASVEAGKASFETKSLGRFVKVEDQSVKKRWSHTILDASTDVSMTYSTDGSSDHAFFGGSNAQEGRLLIDSFKEFFVISSTSNFEESYANKAVSTAKAEGLQVEPKGSSTYAAIWAMKPFEEGQPFLNPLVIGAGVLEFHSQTNPLSATVPVKSPGASVYLVTGTVGGGPDGARKLNATIVDGHAVVPLNNEDTGIADLAPRMFNAAYKTSGGAMSGQPQDATTPVAYLVVVEPEAKPVDKPVAASGLVYNGTEQVGVPEGVGYDLASGKATSAGAHKSVATLREGYAWSDGSTAPVVLDWTIDKAPLTATYRGETIATGEKPSLLVDVTGFVNGETPETAAGYVAPKVLAQSLEEGTHDLKPSGGAADNYAFAYEGGTLTVRKAAGEHDLAPGTYTVTANLSMPGKFNPLIPGLTVYANSPNNPFGPTIDENKDVDVQAEIPRAPLSMNAKIVVSKDGTRTLVLPIRNPIFTTQEIGACDRLSDVRTERVRPTAGGGDWSGSYNKRTDRIHMMSAVLPAGQAKGTATFDFKGSVLYAVPLDTELRPEGDVSLRLTVDYDSMAKASDSTELPGFAKVENGGSTVDPRPNDNPHGENSGSGGTNAGGTDAGDPISSEDGHLAAGSYTVSANIWVNREEAGLPLSPHFTNSSFPPSSSVSKNATLTVGPDGHAYVTIPIIIQSRIMHVLSISGLDIVSSTYDGEGGLTSITVDLGILRDASTITKTATASIRLGSLANSIIGGPADRTWSVTFEVVFNGAPTQTGGTLPKAALDIINAQGADGKAADGKARADAAAADALAALDAQKGLSAGGSSRPTKGEGVLGGCQEAIRNNPALKMGLGLLALAAAAGIAFAARRRRDASPDAPKED
ncbi:MBG domain-containing protein [Olsenella sp. HMSC062G07]|uniref:MBG domain-containing protein n=1 Tax=Olsenella sp. HMSC062G07 TaxID=1739330 RepID=UPI0008A25205|nr:MBG domain-containing protein [Olsenella sp. HMSC062G07]OFK23001.1 hypothetical protein HMPREF2826_00620 [Olsenella sp. HMSC062G07]